MDTTRRMFLTLNLVVFLENIQISLFRVNCEVNPPNVVISFNRWNTSDKHPVGQIEEYLGDVSDEYSTIRMLFAKVGIRLSGKKMSYSSIDFPSNKKIDYRTFSIDPAGCRDIDDAFHFTGPQNGDVEIGIHIANVVNKWYS